MREGFTGRARRVASDKLKHQHTGQTFGVRLDASSAEQVTNALADIPIRLNGKEETRADFPAAPIASTRVG